MRILFTRFPLESTYGGAEVQTLSLMKGLRERGHDVMFMGSCPVLLEKAFRFQVSGFRLDIGPPPVTKWGVISFLWRRHIMQRKIIEILRPPLPPPERSDRSDRAGNPPPKGEGTFDVICMLSLSEKLLVTEWATQQGIRVFWIEHDRVGRWLRWNPWLWKLRRLSHLATTVVVSDMSKRIYVKLGWDPERIVVIPNGIDADRFGVMVSPSNHDTLHIGCIARLSPEKGVDLLVEAVKDVPNIHLTIVGAGRDEYHLRQLVQRRTNNEQRITIVSSVPDVATFYRSLDLFVLPSRDHDPCPLAPMEAMACGTPVIMTDACGTAEYVENGKEALVVPAGSSGALREAIVQLQNNTSFRRRLAERGPRVVAEHFSMERMVDQYGELLRKKAVSP